MMQTIERHIQIPNTLTASVRSATVFLDELTQVGSDIWATRAPVAPHRDSTADGFVTYGVVLINDAAFELVHGGEHAPLPVGTVYTFDGRIEHEVRQPTPWTGPFTVLSDGLFAALIWDWPPTWSLNDFTAELLRDRRWK